MLVVQDLSIIGIALVISPQFQFIDKTLLTLDRCCADPSWKVIDLTFYFTSVFILNTQYMTKVNVSCVCDSVSLSSWYAWEKKDLAKKEKSTALICQINSRWFECYLCIFHSLILIRSMIGIETWFFRHVFIIGLLSSFITKATSYSWKNFHIEYRDSTLREIAKTRLQCRM